MKVHLMLIFLSIAFLFIAITSCDKYTGDTSSISGAWRCREESGTSNVTQYSANINRAGAGFDSTYYVVYNLHNIGFEVETYVQLHHDTVITIKDFNGNFTGYGYFRKKSNEIYWYYYASNELLTAYFFRK